MSVLKLFPTHLYRLNSFSSPKMKRLTSDLIDECVLHRDLDTEGEEWSRENYSHGYTSYSSVTDLPNRSSQFAQLRNFIDKEVKKFVRALEIDLENGKLEMSTCWVNMMGKGCYHSAHLHPLSVISGTYYLKVPKNSGKFKIEDPRSPYFMASPPKTSGAKRENQRHVLIPPKAGDLLLFESWLKHEVTENRSDDERISVSFNYDWMK